MVYGREISASWIASARARTEKPIAYPPNWAGSVHRATMTIAAKLDRLTIAWSAQPRTRLLDLAAITRSHARLALKASAPRGNAGAAEEGVGMSLKVSPLH